MAALWTHEDAATATGGRATRPFVATGLSIDTRSLVPGDLFVALKDQRDGHDFVADALRKGKDSPLEVAAYFRGLRAYAGSSGQMDFDKNGDAIKMPAIMRVVNGESVLVSLDERKGTESP